MNIRISKFLLSIILMLVGIASAQAHHVLGRPSYGLSEDSTTPPAIEIESQVGTFYISAMAFPAFISPHETGRINVHIADMNTNHPYEGKVIFKVRRDQWFSNESTILGTQENDDNVYRQSFNFDHAGDYIVSAEFDAKGEKHVFEFPLQVGAPASYNVAAISISAIALLIFTVSIVKRRQIHKLKVKQFQHAGKH